MQKIVEQQWDYTQHAKFYSYRPNYAPKSLDMLALLASGEGRFVAGGGGQNLLLLPTSARGRATLA